MTYTLVLMDDHRDWIATNRGSVLDCLDQLPDEIMEHVDTDGAGFTTQMHRLWERLRWAATDHVLLWEADFTPATTIPTRDMRRIVDADEQLAQVALVRQPWFTNEHKVGGLLASLEVQGHTFTQHEGWLEHTAGWTNNPCIFRRELVDRFAWPDGDWSEARFGRVLRAAGFRFGYLGQRNDPPVVLHEGVRTEASHGY